MAPRRKELVSTEAVREWGRSNGWDVNERGRLNSELIKAYNRAHKDKVYTPDVRSTATRRAQPTPEAVAEEETQAETFSAPVKSGMIEGLPEIMNMLQAATKNGKGGKKVLVAAYTLADLD